MNKEEKSVFEPEIPTVPAGWEVAPFDLVVTTVSDEGKRIKQRDYLSRGNIPVIDQGQDFIGGYTNNEGLAFEGKLPVVLFGDHTRTVKFVDKRFAVGAEGVKVFQPANCYAPKFFYYLLTSLQIPSRGYSRHFQFLKKLYLPLAPPNEQTRIVAEIEKQFSRLDEAVTNLKRVKANLKRVKANLKRYKAAVLKAAVEGKLTEEWRQQHPDVEPADKLLARILVERRKAGGKGKYKEPVAPDTANLPELPAGWVWASVEQISIVVRGASPRPAGDPQYFGGDVPWITVGPITADSDPYLRAVPESLTVEGKERSRFIEAHTLLLTNSGATLGVPKISLIGGCINDGVVALLDVKYPTKLYLLYFLRTLTERLRGINQGAAQPNLNTTIIKEISVSFPPLLEQERIIAEVERRLSIVAGAEAQVDANLRRADRLRQSILKQAFSGQLVPHDPNDEPASMLLERIRNGVGAIHESPARATRKPKRAIHESPLRKPRPQTEPAPAVSDKFACLDDVTAAILGLMQPGREYARVELADPLGLTTSRWNVAIQDLKRQRKVRQVGEKRGARYVRR